MRPLYIFDLDGTLADCEHRKHLIQGPRPNWDLFFAYCTSDTPILTVITTMDTMLRTDVDVWIWSGRSENVRTETENWLYENTAMTHGEIHANTKMRPSGDTTPDEALKESWLNEMDQRDRQRLVAVFDDRNKVVAMWRKRGVTCFQVAPGDF